MKKIIYILLAMLFVLTGSAIKVPAQETPAQCTNSICSSSTGTCQVKFRFRCQKAAFRCFNIQCEVRLPLGQGPEFDPVARTMKVSAGNFVSEDGIKMKNRMSVPLTAMFSMRNARYVYLMRKRKALMRRVTAGAMGETDVEVTKELKPGDRVVMNPLSIYNRRRKK